MPKEKDQNIISAIGIPIARDFVDRLIQNFLNFKSQTPGKDQTDRIRTAILKNIKIPGFRPGLAPRNHYLIQLQIRFSIDTGVLLGLATTWIESHRENFDLLANWENNRKYIQPASNGDPREESIDKAFELAVDEIAAHFINEHPNFDIMEAKFLYSSVVRLGISTNVEGEKPQTFDAHQTEEVASKTLVEKTTADDVWNELTDYVLAHLPDDITIEDGINFGNRISKLIEMKLASSQRELLLNELQPLFDTTTEVLEKYGDYYEFSKHKEWNLTEIETQTIEEIKEQFLGLTEDLKSKEELDNTIPRTANGRQEHSKAVGIIDSEITEKLHKLSTFFPQTTKISKDQIPSPNVVLPTFPPETPDQVPETTKFIEQTTNIVEDPEIAVDKVDFVDDIIVKNEDVSLLTEQPKDSDELTFQEPENVAADQKNEQQLVELEVLEEKNPEIQKSINLSPENSLVTFLQTGDLPSAYWLSRAFEERGGYSGPPSWLLFSIQANLWFLNDFPNNSNSILNEVENYLSDKNITIPSEYSPLGFSLLLGLGLFSTSGILNSLIYLEIPDGFPKISELSIKIDAFLNRGLYLTPSNLASLVGNHTNDANTKIYSHQASEWLERSSQRRVNFPNVWTKFVGKDGIIHSFFDIVIKDDRKSKSVVAKALENWSDRKWIESKIQHFHSDTSLRSGPIVGNQREQFISWILNGVQIAENWVNSIQPESADNSFNNQRDSEINIFVTFLRENIPALVEELQNRQGLSKEFLGTTLLTNMLLVLGKIIGGIEFDPTTTETPEYDPDYTLIKNIESILRYFPGIGVTDEGKIWASSSEVDPVLLLQNGPMDPESSLQNWVNNKNYTYCDKLLDEIPNEKREVNEKFVERQFNVHLEELESLVDDSAVRVEQANADNLFPESDLIFQRAIVESARRKIQDYSSGINYLIKSNLAPIFSELIDQNDQIQQKQKEKLSTYLVQWESIKSHLAKIVLDETITDQVIKVVTNSFEKNDIRSVGEAIAHLDEVRSGIRGFEKDLFVIAEDQIKIEEYLKETKGINNQLDAFIQIDTLTSEYSVHLPQDRKNEIDWATSAWKKLKKEQSKNARDAIFPHVLFIMRYLGFELPSTGSPISLRNDVPPNFVHWILQARTRVVSAVPQFGSERLKDGLNNYGSYDVIGAWGRPGIDAIEALGTALSRRPILMLYFGRLNITQRTELLKLKKKQLQIIVVDETLLVYLSGEYKVRLTSMLQCTLPFANINPYTPFATGSVPPEMYFGRSEEISKLMDPYGPCIVYGGRQLGKSALLRQVQRKFQDKENGQYAIYEDIRLIGQNSSDQTYQLDFTERIQTALISAGVIEKQIRILELKKLCDLLIEQTAKKRIKLLLLIDEADNFLEAEAIKNFPVVTELKRVMDQTNRLFKVVFAGLHHVQQFTKTPNQPLTHLGDTGAVLVGPLEPKAAIELISKPLHDLGYVFGSKGSENPSLLFHILSYTNYHPGLLQLFGHSLVEHLNNKSTGSMPPYSISKADIESVYNLAKVKDSIKDRLNITITLDERYELITLTLILDQWNQNNGFNLSYTPENIHKIVTSYWKKGFDSNPGSIKVILDEMCGLGVLSKNKDENRSDNYRLRSPNLVSLMGTIDQILNRIDLISKSDFVDQQRKLESFHAPNPPYFSPLTFAQERSIVGDSSGVCLIFGTQATNIFNVRTSVEEIAKKRGGWIDIKISSPSKDAFSDQLKKIGPDSSNSLIAFRQISGSLQEMQDQVSEAYAFCRHQKSNKLFRVVFSFDETSTKRWMSMPKAERIKFEFELSDSVIILGKWDSLGVRQLFSSFKQEIMPNEPNIHKFFENTGGWPILVDKFIQLSPDKDAPVDELKNVLNFSLEENGSIFLTKCGLDSVELIEFTSKIISQQTDLKSLAEVSEEEILDFVFPDLELGKALGNLDYLKRICVISTTDGFNVDPLISKIIQETNA